MNEGGQRVALSGQLFGKDFFIVLRVIEWLSSSTKISWRRDFGKQMQNSGDYYAESFDCCSNLDCYFFCTPFFCNQQVSRHEILLPYRAVKRAFQVAKNLPPKTRMTSLVSHPTNKQTINYRNIVLRSHVTSTFKIRYNLTGTKYSVRNHQQMFWV